ncbi:hypothetical protein [Azospirillum rugosum]|uniref:Uncharacterized protein n=1 Tax=Azospirillum rugosum TaxID=416170 RepID=A0ABS4SUC0_9PROT|nr:hypothetical protein [Azospirillum rugosum]MBP2295567.1 hypothetical protein [Azospirillum rugosum]MDQ0529543.1 hypothetical protein [Azospirillum rugosum]
MLRLVMTEPACDGLEETLRTTTEDSIAGDALKAFRYVRDSGELRRLLTEGLDLTKAVSKKAWTNIPAGANTDGLQNIAQVAWNCSVPDGPFDRNKLRGTGLMLLVQDVQGGGPGLGDVLRAGLVAVATNAEGPIDDVAE